MKRRIIKILIFIVLFIPIKIKAKEAGISNYFIEATVLQNGDLYVKELFVLEGKFNGYERIINFSNLNASRFDGTVLSFAGSDIYNGEGIKLIKIMSLVIDENINFDYLFKKGDEFQKNNFANSGDYGYYSITEKKGGTVYKIFNPSRSGKRGFFLEYIIENLAITHLDVAEIGWNLFTEEQREGIKNLEMIVNIPNNKRELRVWGHGPLNGETDLLGKAQIGYKIKELPSSTPIDIRFVFDKDILIEKKKETNLLGLEKILEIEKKWADEANLVREEAKKEIEEEARKKELLKQRIGYPADFLKVFWAFGLIYILYYVYNKHDKEYQSTFKTKYFRDFPGSYGPSIVGYLLNRRIGTKEISATILDLIARKHITYQSLKKNNYQLIYNLHGNDQLTKTENKLIEMLFHKIGHENKVTIQEINKYAKTHYQSFLNEYNDWRDLALTESKEKNFYEKKGKVKVKTIIYSLIGLIGTLVTINYTNYFYLTILVLILSMGSLIYFGSITKRSKEGQDHYLKWKGLDRFLRDFGKFKARDLPQIELWEKYLVYAVVFGSAKRLAKTMEIKFTEMPTSGYTVGDYMFDVAYFRMLNNLNYSIDNGLSKAVSSALSTKSISESRTSSSGGFGGGFSGGGGSFGGGGGGGRF